MNKNPLISIAIGSDSDLKKTVQEACATLDELEIPYECGIKSAHRTAEEMAAFARDARKRGIKVIIAAAGGAAHLPGMIEAFSTASIPVIGVPVMTSTLAGLDSLFSIVQMPPGRPVACMAINGSKNAAIYAAQIIGLLDEAVAERVEAYQKKLHDEVRAKDEKLGALGWKAYLQDNDML